MDKQLEEALKAEAIRHMKNPTILMNPIDFETINKVKNRYCHDIKGIPVLVRDFVVKGEFLVFDNVIDNLPEYN